MSLTKNIVPYEPNITLVALSSVKMLVSAFLLTVFVTVSLPAQVFLLPDSLARDLSPEEHLAAFASLADVIVAVERDTAIARGNSRVGTQEVITFHTVFDVVKGSLTERKLALTVSQLVIYREMLRNAPPSFCGVGREIHQIHLGLPQPMTARYLIFLQRTEQGLELILDAPSLRLLDGHVLLVKRPLEELEDKAVEVEYKAGGRSMRMGLEEVLRILRSGG